MAVQVRVNPVFYDRLTTVFQHLRDGIDHEVELMARHFEDVRSAFADRWDDQVDVPGSADAKMVIGAMGDDHDVIFAVTAQRCDSDTVEIRTIVTVARP